MQVNYIKYFVDIARSGSITAAAAENFISVQGMSRSISTLEQELGCTLFDRKPNRLALNEYGKRVLPHAEQMLAARASMLDEVARTRELDGGSPGRTINAYLNNIAFDSAFFSPLTSTFDEMFSNARYFQCDNDTVVESLLNSVAEGDTLDFGLLCFFSPMEEENEGRIRALRENGFRYQPYIQTYDMALVSSKSDLAGNKFLTRSDMVSRPIAASNGDIRRVIETLFGKSSIGLVTADSVFRFKAVADSDVISTVPAFHNLVFSSDSSIPEGTVAVPMKDPYYVEVGFAVREEVFESPYMQALFQNLYDFYAQYVDSPYITLVSSDLTAMRTADHIVDASQVKAVLALEDEYGISARERDVLECLVEGLTAVPIAEKLYISAATAKSHIYSIYKKLGVHSQNEVIAILEKTAERIGA